MRKNPAFSRLLYRATFILPLILQLCLIPYLIYSTEVISRIAGAAFKLLSIVVVIHVLNKRYKNAYKILWVTMIMIFPLFGGCFYLLSVYRADTKRFRLMLKNRDELLRPFFAQSASVLPEALLHFPEYGSLTRYLESHAGYPVYNSAACEYFRSGEVFFERALEEIEKAEKYVFLEFFIIKPGKMLDEMLALLEKKAKAGVDVRLLYDDIGCFISLPGNFRRTLETRGIKCAVFNPFSPFLSTLQNNRDHRKIISIDGKTAFTGGANLADEYINEIERYGHWRDTAILINGEAAWSLTLIFLQMWSFASRKTDDYAALYPSDSSKPVMHGTGYVQPYADSPMDKEVVGENVFMQIINQARDYLYISTPYLILDENIMSALTFAAKSGVDVRIITPHIWDKRLVYITTRSYYRELIEAGVKIYEYAIGFNHSKALVSDDKIAAVGTANMDYRSLYLHFECGVAMYGCGAIRDIKADMLDILGICKEITLEGCKSRTPMRLLQNILRMFAPLM